MSFMGGWALALLFHGGFSIASPVYLAPMYIGTMYIVHAGLFPNNDDILLLLKS